jgi:DNA replication protein DnaC
MAATFDKSDEGDAMKTFSLETAISVRNILFPTDFSHESMLALPYALGLMLDSLKEKKNIILQGPPGVGKTFVATRLAYALMETQDSSHFRMDSVSSVLFL